MILWTPEELSNSIRLTKKSKTIAKRTVSLLADLVEKFASQVQIGRTHGQHALPITVGFWLATILQRILYNWKQMEVYSEGLVGKISGAVGAYNAQVGLQLEQRCGSKTFEDRVLEKLGLSPAKISTQILLPEPLAYFLFSCVITSASFGQLGRDCRHLMRTEIAEVMESFEKDQVGSSTMAHKRNPINFENIEGMWLKTKMNLVKSLIRSLANTSVIWSAAALPETTPLFWLISNNSLIP